MLQSALTKPLLKLGHDWVITPYGFTCMYLLIHDPSAGLADLCGGPSQLWFNLYEVMDVFRRNMNKQLFHFSIICLKYAYSYPHPLHSIPIGCVAWRPLLELLFWYPIILVMLL